MRNSIKIILAALFVILLVVIVFLPSMSPKMDDVGILKTFIPYEMEISNDDIERDPIMGLKTTLQLSDRPLVETTKWFENKGFEVFRDQGDYKGVNHAGATFVLTGDGEKSTLVIRYFAD